MLLQVFFCYYVINITITITNIIITIIVIITISIILPLLLLLLVIYLFFLVGGRIWPEGSPFVRFLTLGCCELKE